MGPSLFSVPGGGDDPASVFYSNHMLNKWKRKYMLVIGQVQHRVYTDLFSL